MKTTQRIAEDCGISEHRAEQLSDILGGRWGERDVLDDAQTEIIGALYRRIEKLEEENAELLKACQDEVAGRIIDRVLAERTEKQWAWAQQEIKDAKARCAAYQDQLEAERKGG